MLSYAEEREVEEATRPLWIAHYAIQKMSGAEPLPYDEFILSILEGESPGATPATAPRRAASEIEEELLSIVEADRLKRRKEG